MVQRGPLRGSCRRRTMARRGPRGRKRAAAMTCTTTTPSTAREGIAGDLKGATSILSRRSMRGLAPRRPRRPSRRRTQLTARRGASSSRPPPLPRTCRRRWRRRSNRPVIAKGTPGSRSRPDSVRAGRCLHKGHHHGCLHTPSLPRASSRPRPGRLVASQEQPPGRRRETARVSPCRLHPGRPATVRTRFRRSPAASTRTP